MLNKKYLLVIVLLGIVIAAAFVSSIAEGTYDSSFSTAGEISTFTYGVDAD